MSFVNLPLVPSVNLNLNTPHTLAPHSTFSPHIAPHMNYAPVDSRSYNNSFNHSSPNLLGGGLGGLVPYTGYGGLSPYMYGGYGGGLPAYGSMYPYVDPYGYVDEDALEEAFEMGYISGSQYNNTILMLDGRDRRRSWFPCRRRRDPYMRVLAGGGFGYGGLGRRGLLDSLDLIRPRGLRGWYRS